MIKIAGVCLVILSCTGIGYLMSVQLTRRYQELKMLQRMVVLIKGEISYGKSALPEVLAQVGKKLEEPFQNFLLMLAKKTGEYGGKSFTQLFSESVDENLHTSFLSAKDKGNLKQMGQYLGYLDIAMQMNMLEMYLKELEMEIQETGNTIPGKKKIYQSLGIMSGIFLAIVFV